MLSCGALLQRDEPVDVLNVFVGEPGPDVRTAWDVRRGFDDSRESVDARRLEDDAAFAGTPHRRFFLPLLDHQYQGRRPDADRDVLSDFIRQWASGHEGGRIVLPLGGGRSARTLRRGPLDRVLPPRRPAPHPDHEFVRDVGLAALRDVPGARPILFEEYPYVLGERRLLVPAAPAAGGPWALVEIEVAVDRDEKLRRLDAYSSQLAPREGEIDWLRRMPRLERYWVLTRREGLDAR
ncbi:MAG TPA: hypothetical protein VG265_07525 [Gaiellaceae bacterium]|nr:hypothetical protein [Gaiellaceae bacterium]